MSAGRRTTPFVSVISLLGGMILGFVGAIQLKMFGAEIYVATHPGGRGHGLADEPHHGGPYRRRF